MYRWLPPPNDRLIPHLQPSGLVDFTNPEAYAWYRDMHRDLFEMGVSVMKTDYGEALPEDVVGHNGDTGKRLHNIYTLLYNRCTFEASQMYGDKDGVVWGRASWAGGQRYPVQWGGDPQGDWEGLAGSIRGGLSWGMSGGAFYAHDIGGFYGVQESGGLLGTGMPDPELYIRWAQAGVMCSHTRFHGTSPREPWFFGEQAEEIIRKWLAWRYQLIPYLQGCALEASQTGMPVMRAMNLAFPEDPLAWQFEHQYMLGPSLLVAPVIQAGGHVRFYLPAGKVVRPLEPGLGPGAGRLRARSAHRPYPRLRPRGDPPPARAGCPAHRRAQSRAGPGTGLGLWDAAKRDAVTGSGTERLIRWRIGWGA
jgi:alpha-D-xyloside xylohydrolase